MKKVIVLYNLNHHEYEYETEFDSEITIDAIRNALSKKYEVELVEVKRDFSWIDYLIKSKPDLVFNVCEGYKGPARESVYAAILEQLGILYTGPDSTNLLMCHNKLMVKKLMSGLVNVPKGFVVRTIGDLNKLPELKYPVIVKLNSEGSSIGLSEKSIVYLLEDLSKRVEFLYKNYESNILIEEYIEGTDISMIYIEGIGPLGPCLVQCNSMFYDYEMKTTKDDTVEIEVMSGNYQELYDIVKIIVHRLDIKGYAKIDFRVNESGYYLIEVNGQVSFHPTGEFITCAKTKGYSLEEVILHIADSMLKTKQKEYSIGIGDDYGIA